MAVHGRNMRDVDALIISHDHIDHIRCAGVYQRLFGFPIYVTQRTLAATWCKLGSLRDVRHFSSGDTLTFGCVTVYTIPTAHDAADGVAFVIECEGTRLGIFTDLGHPFDGLRSALESVDAAYLECNYDPEMLESGPYPAALKARIKGAGGHLSNGEAAGLVGGCGRRRPRWIAVAHLSQENNRPELAIEAQRGAVGTEYPVYLASRYQTSEMFRV
jgi:phosphoribosyl 1,2-cyclic phosphodiesterase